ncbi:hypothetical protein [Shimia sp.]|uniref:hypothetical protein n=1 Tax=Shimia sp. TaxID=1954381 RepID=UPI003B8E7903
MADKTRILKAALFDFIRDQEFITSANYMYGGVKVGEGLHAYIRVDVSKDGNPYCMKRELNELRTERDTLSTRVPELEAKDEGSRAVIADEAHRAIKAKVREAGCATLELNAAWEEAKAKIGKERT